VHSDYLAKVFHKKKLQKYFSNLLISNRSNVMKKKLNFYGGLDNTQESLVPHNWKVPNKHM
jgi:hypothetical protein